MDIKHQLLSEHNRQDMELRSRIEELEGRVKAAKIKLYEFINDNDRCLSVAIKTMQSTVKILEGGEK